MAADLRSNTMFARNSLLVMDDCLVKLEHTRTEDRVRKFMFDSIEAVILWRQVPWGRMAVAALVFVLPGLALQLTREIVGICIGIFLIALGLSLVAWYALWRKTTIRIVRAGTTNDIVGIFRPKKVRRLRDRLLAGIRSAQAGVVTAAPAIEAVAQDG